MLPDQTSDLGQVVFALRVVGRELGRGLAQELDRCGVNPSVDLGDAVLGVGGVLVLDHIADYARVVADHPAVAGRIADHGGQHGQAAAAVGGLD